MSFHRFGRHSPVARSNSMPKAGLDHNLFENADQATDQTALYVAGLNGILKVYEMIGYWGYRQGGSGFLMKRKETRKSHALIAPLCESVS